tara:strand:- start:125 stop:634 length:510 start_codon:yes stop_codon:yes gene_type:complete
MNIPANVLSCKALNAASRLYLLALSIDKPSTLQSLARAIDASSRATQRALDTLERNGLVCVTKHGKTTSQLLFIEIIGLNKLTSDVTYVEPTYVKSDVRRTLFQNQDENAGENQNSPIINMRAPVLTHALSEFELLIQDKHTMKILHKEKYQKPLTRVQRRFAKKGAKK